MVSIRKRGAVYGVIGLMLCVAVYLNWSYFQSPEELTIADQAMEEDAAAGSVYGEVTAVDSADSKAYAIGLKEGARERKKQRVIILPRHVCRVRQPGMKR